MKENQTKETGRKEPAPIQKLNDEVANAFESCANALSLNELSRVTGVRIELLRRFISKKTRRARAETWGEAEDWCFNVNHVAFRIKSIFIAKLLQALT